MKYDPTLLAIDAAIEKKSNSDLPRPYLGMSQIGDPCPRKLWYSFRHAKVPSRSARLIKAAEDGNTGEALMIERLRMVDGVDLYTLDTDNEQHQFSDFSGHFMGHPDGFIEGILQCPDEELIWEHKQVNQKKFDELIKCIEKYGEENALRSWDVTYYGQAVCMMYYGKTNRHYLTVSTPGGRDTISCITNKNHAYAAVLIERAESIIFTNQAPPRISDNPNWFYCKHFCDFHDICHEKSIPQVNCRTCVYSTPQKDGGWKCEKMNEPIEKVMMCGGEKHLYIPDMIGRVACSGKSDDGSYIEYADGRINREGGGINVV